MREPAPAQASQPAPAPARCLSEDEEADEETAEDSEPAFFSTSAGKDEDAEAPAAEPAPAEAEPDLVAAPAHPQFAELAEEPAYTPLPRDFASDFGNGVRSPEAEEEPASRPAAPSAPVPGEEAERDLDVPAFMRRLRF